MRVLITGANGFVGTTLSHVLAQSGYVVRAALRGDHELPTHVAEKVVVGDLDRVIDWRAALSGVDYVVHAAARAHVLGDSPANAKLYFETNVRGTLCLANAAARSGVRRFIYLSSVKVNGEQSEGSGFRASDEPQPQDPYGTSKWLAEQMLMERAADGLQVVVLRLPLVYGPGVRANFLRLMQWVDRGWPLPLGSIHNKRSVVSVWNLCDLIERTLEHPVAPGRIWMVADTGDLSTPELIRSIAKAMRKQVVLLPVPSGLLRAVASVCGKGPEAARLCGSLTVDAEQTRLDLDWSPPVATEEALTRTVKWYLHERRSRD
jgi:nucleoside-diphosphate-sugar epimerase